MRLKLGDLDIPVDYKAVKRLTLRVKGASVTVTAPRGVDIETIRVFVESKSDWIRDTVTSQRVKLEDSMRYVYLYGVRYPLRVVEGRRGASLTDGKFVVSIPDPLDTDGILKLRDRCLRNTLTEYLSVRVPELERHVSLYSSGWYVRDMRTRYGTCNTVTGRLCFALGLVAYDTECIDYVIVHELLHLRYKGHGEDFKSALRGFVPGYRAIRKRMRG